MASVHLQAASKAAWAVCGRSPAAGKIPRSHHSAHNRWSTFSSPDSGEYINKTNDNKGKADYRAALAKIQKGKKLRPGLICELLCATLRGTPGTDAGKDCEGGFGPVSEGLRGTKRAAGEREGVVAPPSRSQTPAVRAFPGFRFWVVTELQKRFLGCKIKNP